MLHISDPAPSATSQNATVDWGIFRNIPVWLLPATKHNGFEVASNIKAEDVLQDMSSFQVINDHKVEANILLTLLLKHDSNKFWGLNSETRIAVDELVAHQIRKISNILSTSSTTANCLLHIFQWDIVILSIQLICLIYTLMQHISKVWVALLYNDKLCI